MEEETVTITLQDPPAFSPGDVVKHKVASDRSRMVVLGQLAHNGMVLCEWQATHIPNAEMRLGLFSPDTLKAAAE